MKVRAVCAWSLVLGIAACRPVGSAVVPPSDHPAKDASSDGSAPPLVPQASVGVDAGAPPPGPLAPLRWGTRPDPAAPLAYAIDGYCVQADVDLLPNATLVHFGEHGVAAVARATDDGLEDWDRLSRGMVGYYLGHITGSYPDNLWFDVNNGGRAYNVDRQLRFEQDHWVSAWGALDDQHVQYRQLVAVAGGAIAASYTCGNGDGSDCTPGPLVAHGVTAPPIAGDGFRTSRLVPFAAGDVWAFGEVCRGAYPNETCTTQVRRWKPGAKLAVDVLAGAVQELRSVVSRAPDDVTISLAGKVLHFDGMRWQPLAWAGKLAGGELHLAPDGALWRVDGATGKIERRAPDGTVTDLSLPSGLAGYVGDTRRPAIDGIELGAPWAALGDGTVVRWEGSSWTNVPLPRSPYAWSESKNNVPKAESVRVRSAKDVWINVKYVEWPAHYQTQLYEERRALLRTQVPKETYRCRDGTFESFPPLATAECKTPMVVLATIDAKTVTDWPQSKKLLAGKKELAGTVLVELVAGSKKILGARVPSFDVGKKVLMVMRNGLPYSKPEMVCADPDQARVLAFDVSDGGP